ncbi:hypothetical protein I316_05908 [Kwoniella heveanensis BCC8398]|uniref:Uncharacterized protein n=1 Tax=Kwoniella heveanensis BCC8398 TaxID=1296120 RepID=A0A1B9GNB1_9TREE|nr:hypothetical protein I316_05908 [Kwoniella heveanensis BCC8398]
MTADSGRSPECLGTDAVRFILSLSEEERVLSQPHIKQQFIEAGDEEELQAMSRWQALMTGPRALHLLTGGRRRENENDDREEEEENGYEWTQYPDHEYAYWIDFEQGIFELQSASHEERWTFAQLRKKTGFWMALVRSQILSEKTLEE